MKSITTRCYELFFEDLQESTEMHDFHSIVIKGTPEPQSRFIALVTKGNTQTTTLAYLHRDLAGDDLLLLEIVAVTVYSDSGVASGKLSFYINA